MKTIFFQAIFIFFVMCSILYSQNGWQQISPLPQGDNLQSCHFIDNNTGYAVGWAGTIIKTTNSGVNWSVQYKNRSYYINSVSFKDANTGFAVGNSGCVIKTTNSGLNWTPMSDIAGNTLRVVQFINTSTGFMCGDQASIFKTTNGGDNWILTTISATNFRSMHFINTNTGWIASGDGVVYRTTNGGTNWSNIYFGGAYDIVCLKFLNSNTGWYSTSINYGTLKKTTDGGTTWTTKLTSTRNGYLMSVDFLNDSIGCVTGNYETFHTTNHGENWIQNTEALGNYNCVKFTSENNVSAFGDAGQIVKSTNNGQSFSTYYSYFSGNLKNMFFANSNTGWMTGSQGIIYKSVDGGMNWISYSVGESMDIRSMEMFDENSGWICGYGGNTGVKKTLNGGINWIGVGDFNINYTSMDFVNSSTGFAIDLGVSFFKTTNAGVSWSSRFIASGFSTLFYVKFQNALTGIVAANSSIQDTAKILRTTNGGSNWSVIRRNASNIYYSAEFLDDNLGWITAFGEVIKTTDGGLTWTSYPCGGFNIIRGAYFLNINTGWAVVNSASVLKTTNGGTVWTTVTNLNTLVTLSSPHFLNENTGWIMGTNGTLYKTTNGGVIFISSQENNVSSGFQLEQNYPNPFNPNTLIKFSIPKNDFVVLKIFNIAGKEVQTLVNENLNTGSYNINFDGSNLTSGVYFYRLSIGDFTESKKMILIK